MSTTLLKVGLVLCAAMLHSVDAETVSATIGDKKNAYVRAVLGDTIALTFETPATELYQFSSDDAFKDCNMAGARKVATTSIFSFVASPDVIFGQVPTAVAGTKAEIRWINHPTQADLDEEDEIFEEDPDYIGVFKNHKDKCKDSMLAVLRFAAIPKTRGKTDDDCGKSVRVKVCSANGATKQPTAAVGNQNTKAPTKAPVKGAATKAPVKAPVKGTKAPTKTGATKAPTKTGATKAPVKGDAAGTTAPSLTGTTKSPSLTGTTKAPSKPDTGGAGTGGGDGGEEKPAEGDGGGAMIAGIVVGLGFVGGGAFLIRRRMNSKGNANLGSDDDEFGMPPMAILYDESKAKSDMEDDLSIAYPDSVSSGSPRNSGSGGSSVAGSVRSKFSGMMGRGVSHGSVSTRGSVQSSNPQFQSDELSSEVMAAYANEESINEDQASTYSGAKSASGGSTRSGGRSTYSVASSRASRMTGNSGRTRASAQSRQSGMSGQSGRSSGQSGATGRSGKTSYSGMSAGGMSAGGSMFSASQDDDGQSIMSGGTYQSGQTYQSEFSNQSGQSDGRSVQSNRTGGSGRSGRSQRSGGSGRSYGSRPTTLDSNMV